MGWSQSEAVRGKPWFQDQEAPARGWRGGVGDRKQEANAVPFTPAIFTRERWTTRGLAKNTSGPSPEHHLPRGAGGGVWQGVGWGPEV